MCIVQIILFFFPSLKDFWHLILVVRSTLNSQKKRVKNYHKELNISDAELLSRTDLNSMY